MKGDFSRQTLCNARKRHYIGVLMQQGRVQLDADWNEQQGIFQNRIETGSLDLIGMCGAPRHNPGFCIMTEETQLSKEEKERLARLGILPLKGDNFLIGPGHYYVDGILCENDEVLSFTTQIDLLNITFSGKPETYLAYLDVWHRHMTALDDPLIREKALGGPDTTTRIKTVWQVRVSPLNEWEIKTESTTGMLAACAGRPDSSSGDSPCLLLPTSGYKRLENQLYRVEIHDPGSPGDKASFKWSRDNGSIVAKIDKMSNDDPKKLIVKDIGPDTTLRFAPQQWVEVINNELELNGTPGCLIRIKEVDLDKLEITLEDAPTVSIDAKLNPKLRQWDGKGLVEIPADNDGWIGLESGIEVKFSQGTYKSGDYWLIPARSVTGDIEWPYDETPDKNPLPQPPLGIQHHYCKLALLDFNGFRFTKVEDCRRIFAPLADDIGISKVLLNRVGYGDNLLHNGMDISSDILANGLRIIFHEPIDKSIVSHASCSVTLELPFPLTSEDQKIWGDAVIGYQPFILGAYIQIEKPRELCWYPLNETVAFFQNIWAKNVKSRIRCLFQQDWEVFDPEGSPSSNWDYNEKNYVVQSSGDTGAGEKGSIGFGTISINKQRLRENAQYIGLTATKPLGTYYYHPYPLYLGMVFNWRNNQDYWLFQCGYYPWIIGRGTLWFIKGVVMHIKDGQLADEDVYINDIIGNSPCLPEEISLDIKQSKERLIFGILVEFKGGNGYCFNDFSHEESFEVPQAPKKLEEGSGVGMATRFTGGAQFTRMEIVYPDGKEVLIPPVDENRILAHLAVKRFLPKYNGGIGINSRYCLNSQTTIGTVHSEADFEQWFWMVPPMPRYGYGYGYSDGSGYGTSLISGDVIS